MYNTIQPVLVANGVFCVPQVIEKDTETFTSAKGTTTFRVLLKISHKFFAEDGSSVDVITLGEGIDTSDKAANKAMSAAMKYAFIELFSIPTEDIEDPDKESPQVDGAKKIAVVKPEMPPAGPTKAPSRFSPRSAK